MKTARVWIALFVAPVVLALAFLPFVATLASRGLEGDALLAAMESIAVYPSLLGFPSVFVLAWRGARADGESLASLGWTVPRPASLALALALGVVVATLNHLLLHPFIQQHQPMFDPTLPSVPLWAIVATLIVATVAEDTLYRGYALQVLGQRHGAKLAVLLTSTFYASMTPGAGWPLMLWAFGFGLLLAGLKLQTRSLPAVVLTHLLVGLAPRLLA